MTNWLQKVNLYIYIYILFFSIILISCKTKLDVIPKESVNVNNLNYTTEDINTLALNLELGFLHLLQNDTIKNVTLFLTSKGYDGYFWVSFQKLEDVLDEEYGIRISNRFNNVLVEQFNFEYGIDYYNEIMTLLNESNSLPHIFVPNLDMLCSAIVNDNGILEGESGPLVLEDFQVLESNVKTAVYINHQPEFTLHYLENEIIEEESSFEDIGSSLLFVFAHKIIDPCIQYACDDEYAQLRNCIVNIWGCKVCNEVEAHNSIITDNASGNFGADEIQIKLGFNISNYPPNQNAEIDQCIEYIHPPNILNLPQIYYLNNNKSYAILKSLYGYEYYHPNYGNSSEKLKKTNLPIRYFTVDNYYSAVDVRKVTLCYRGNYFNIYGDNFYNNTVLAGGIYQIKKYNSLPLYFVFPGHIYGGMFWTNGADNIIQYDLNSSNSYCNNGYLSVSESFKLSSACDFCNNNIFGLGDQFFVNTDLGFLMNYWNKDTIIVGIARAANFNIMPKENYAKFGQGSVSCNINFSNKTKVAELKSYNDNTIDNYVKFIDQTTFQPGTVFYVKINATFSSGNSIDNCTSITTNSTYNNSGDLLREVSLFPRGNITSLKIEIYI